ncbi:MAG: hemerythrin family protein [Desulfuromonadales bacterium]|nr:hemerythrin family protein [Desulfuromonadales bacterium]
MDLLQWDDSFKLNIPRIDEQHERLIELIRDLEDAVQDGTGGLLISYVMQELIRYVGLHFGDEECLMMEYDFPELAVHRQKHSFYISRLQEILEQNRDGDALSTATLAFLKEWIVTHIKGTDQEYGRFIRATQT